MKNSKLLTFALIITTLNGFAADDKTLQSHTHRITGLSCPEREADLRDTVKEREDVKLDSIDYEKAEATFTYSTKIISTESLGHVLGRRGFGIKPRLQTPLDKLTAIEIPVVGLDCKGCSLGTYNAIIKIDGVEHATVSYKTGMVLAKIDAAKTNKAALEAALKKANVTLKSPPEEVKPK